MSDLLKSGATNDFFIITWYGLLAVAYTQELNALINGCSAFVMIVPLTEIENCDQLLIGFLNPVLTRLSLRFSGHKTEWPCK